MKRVPNSIPFYWIEILHCARCVATVAHARKTGPNLATLPFKLASRAPALRPISRPALLRHSAHRGQSHVPCKLRHHDARISYTKLRYTHCHAKSFSAIRYPAVIRRSYDRCTKISLVLKPSLREIVFFTAFPRMSDFSSVAHSRGRRERIDDRRSGETARSSGTVEPPGCYQIQQAGLIVMMFNDSFFERC